MKLTNQQIWYRQTITEFGLLNIIIWTLSLLPSQCPSARRYVRAGPVIC